jgi:GT2 family glycosyltransferase
MGGDSTAAVLLSIVIPAYGGCAQLRRCLEAIRREQQAGRIPSPSEVVVADDATPGGLDPDLIAAFPEVHWVFADRNLGFAGNTNRGVAASTGSLLALLNTDMYVEPGWFEGAIEEFEADPKLFALVGQINEPTGNNDGYKQIRMKGVEVELRTVGTSHSASRRRAAVPYANGGGSFFRRDIFLALGGFCELFQPYYWEDTDLGYRAWKRGFTIIYEPKRRLIHDHQGTIGREKRLRIKRIFRRNRLYFAWRNNTAEPLPKLVWQGVIAPAFRALLKLRFAKAFELLSCLRAVDAIAATRRESYRLDLRSDAELARLWDQSLLKGPDNWPRRSGLESESQESARPGREGD